MQLNPYLSFNGQCEEAFQFYEQVLGGKNRTKFTYAGTPMEKDVPPEWRGRIIHSQLEVGGTLLMGADAPPGQGSAPRGFSVNISVDDTKEGERIFQALADNGTVHMPFQETFWAAGFGMLVDRFGIPWMINCSVRM
jgi:PhnB protein